VIFNYAQEVFANAGYNVSDILFNIVITGSVSLIFTLVGMFTVDKLGRKSLMLIGSGGLAAIHAVMCKVLDTRQLDKLNIHPTHNR